MFFDKSSTGVAIININSTHFIKAVVSSDRFKHNRAYLSIEGEVSDVNITRDSNCEKVVVAIDIANVTDGLRLYCVVCDLYGIKHY